MLMKKMMTMAVLLMSSMLLMGQRAESFRNPVLPGFHPDPSVCRVGDDFYLVNSSFHYFPGVPIYHSRDLVNWEQIGNVLDRPSQLPLSNATSWQGIYAPTIRYHEGTYYMITTNVGNGGNFMVTATNPRGPWSEPIWLKQQGIDPSLYFENGKCYMVSNPGDCIYLCEIDPATGEQLSESKALWQGDGGRFPEGPHIYKKDGYYYLLISEGGTELAHHLTIARSRQIDGPYESNPANPILTNCCRQAQTRQIQGTGHGDFVQAPDGSWWVVFLAYRNYGGSYHHLGRETFLAPVEWKEGEWPTVNGDGTIDTFVKCSTLPIVTVPKASVRTVFKRLPLGPEWLYLQEPIAANYEVKHGRLRLHPHSTLLQNDHPTFLGRRQESAAMVVETALDTKRLGFGTEAGLVVYQIHDAYMKLSVVKYQTGTVAVLMNGRLKSIITEQMGDAAQDETIRLRVSSDGDMYYFDYARGDGAYQRLAAHNCSLLSTEVAGGFTGATVGMYAEGEEAAEFNYFDYEER